MKGQKNFQSTSYLSKVSDFVTIKSLVFIFLWICSFKNISWVSINQNYYLFGSSNCPIFDQSMLSVTQSWLILFNTIDSSLPGPSIQGIFLSKNTGVSCHFLSSRDQTLVSCISCTAGRVFTTEPPGKVKVKVTQSCPTLCDPMNYTVHGILQARILEWVAFPFSRGSSQPRDRTQVSLIAGGFFTSWATEEAQEYWSILESISSPADLPNPGIELGSPVLQVDCLPTELSGKPPKNILIIVTDISSQQCLMWS